MSALAGLFALLASLGVPAPRRAPNPVAAIARDYPECVDELGDRGLDATELRDACEEW